MMVTNLKGKNYTQRLEELGLTTLEERRGRGDLGIQGADREGESELLDLVPDVCSTG